MLFDMLVWLGIIATIIGIYLIISYVNYVKSLKKPVRRSPTRRRTPTKKKPVARKKATVSKQKKK